MSGPWQHKKSKLWFPEGELPRVYDWMVRHIDSVQKAMKYVSDPRACIQAGGFIGMWPIELAKYFRYVYTFEPMPAVFECLKRNTKSLPNVHATRCALGAGAGFSDFAFKRGGSSTAKFDPASAAQIVSAQVTKIDDWNFSRIDALFFDVERGEREVLEGARETIYRDHPVITIEVLTGELLPSHSYMHNLGYHLAEITHNDHIFIWNGK